MNIGFDGKRAFQNSTGLGNYIRSLVAILSRHYPHNRYILFAPKQTDLFTAKSFSKVDAVFPKSSFYKKFASLWRRIGMINEIKKAQLDIFHGVSNELPRGIEKVNIKTVVTVHDLIFERFPKTYNFDERYVHRWKIKHACKVADAVIAISQQTRDDLVNFYKVKASKIYVCYQSCNPIFEIKSSPKENEVVKKRYGLPAKYFLFVSSIAPRKNLVAICEAMILLKEKIDIPLVVIGNGKKEKEAAKALMQSNDMLEKLILLNDLPQSKKSAFTTAADFPAIYQQALALIYPSVFEGFGMPVLEAFWSGAPVICSNASSLIEICADAALYFPPSDHQLLATHMWNIANDKNLADNLREKGFQRTRHFAREKYAEDMMQIYQQVCNS